MTDPEKREPLIIDCSDGRRRAVTFQTGSKLVARSVVIPQGSAGGEAVEKLGLGERQLKGLGVPPDTRPGDFLDAEPPYSDPL